MKVLRKCMALAKFLPYYIYKVIESNFLVAYDIVTPRDHFSPAIVGIPIEPMTDCHLLMVSNLMSMSPGTLTLDISPDRRTLFIHAMYAHDIEKLVYDFKHNFEPRVRDAF